MKRLTHITALVAFGVWAMLGFASPGRATTISVFSTGVDATGNGLAGGAVDPHYTWSTGAGTIGNFGDPYNPATSTFFSAGNYPITFSPQDAFVVPDSGALVGNGPSWNSQNPNAKSISFNDVGGGGGNAPYTYRTTFDLTGLDPSTASIDLTWFVDDWGVIALDGVVQSGNGGGHRVLNAGFVAGVNTLDFVTFNGGGPGGISVQINSASADEAEAPEPGTIALLGLGLSGLVLARRNRRDTAR